MITREQERGTSFPEVNDILFNQNRYSELENLMEGGLRADISTKAYQTTIELEDFCERKGAIVYARSCQAGAILGPDSVKKGAIALIGYSRNYSVGYLEERRTRPLTDNVARLFLEPSNLIPQSLIFGNSPTEAYQLSQKEMRKNLQYMLSSKSSMDERDASPYLWNNIKYQVIFEK